MTKTTNNATNNATTTSLIDADHPWPGLLPFTEDAKAFFHGREAETTELTRLIEREPLTVLFGQSGLGKSSLLNAGVFPRLRRAGYLPLYLRLHFELGAPLLIDQVWQILKDESTRHEVTAAAMREGDSFWKYLHRPISILSNPHGHPVIPVFVFDQFEELFTLGSQTTEQSKQSDSFLQELGELIENRLPPSLEAELTKHPEKLDEFDLLCHNTKIVLAFREDYLAEFEGLKKLIRPIMQNRMRLTPMTASRAAKAIKQAGAAKVSEAVAARIVRFVGGARHDEKTALEQIPVEPALLSLVCRELNEQRLERGETEISADLIQGGNTQQIIEQFYRQGFAGVDIKVRHFVEDRLLTTAGYRDSCALDNALAEPGVTEKAIQTLVERRILRREERIGQVRLELIHDVLAGVAKSSREQRRAEVVLAEAKRQIAKQKQRQRLFSAAAVVLLSVFVGVSLLAVEASRARDAAVVAKQASDQSTQRAEEQRRRAEDESLRAASAESYALQQKTTAETALGRAQVAEIRALEQTRTAEAAKVEGDHNLGLVFVEKAARAFSEMRLNVGRLYASRALSKLDAARTPELRASLRGDRFTFPGTPVSTLAGHRNEVFTVAFTPDGQFLASGSRDGELIIWDRQSGKAVTRVVGGQAPILSAVFSPDGRTMASSSADGAITLRDVPGGKTILTFSAKKSSFSGPTESVFGVAFSPDGRTLASALGDSTVRLWDIASGKMIETFSHRDEVRCVAFSPDGSTLASGSADNTVKLWNVGRSKLNATLSAVGAEVNSLAFSPDGRVLATGSKDNIVRLWDLESGKIFVAFNAHESEVLSVAFSADGRTLASGSKDGSVRLWDVVGNRLILTLSGHKGSVHSVAFQSDGRTLASGSVDKSVRLWDVAQSVEKDTFNGHTAAVHGVTISADGRTMASASADRSVVLWNVATGAAIATLNGHDGPVNSVAFSADGRVLASGAEDISVRVWDVSTGKVIATLRGHKDSVNSVSLSPNGQTLVSGSSDRTVRLWDVVSGKAVATLVGPKAAVLAVVISPDGRSVVAGSADRVVTIWDVLSNKVVAEFVGHNDEVSSVAFSADGRILASGSADQTIRLWNVTSGKLIAKLIGQNSAVTSVAFSNTGNMVASSSANGSIRLWDINSGKPIIVMNGHRQSVSAVAFSPDGSRLISASADKTVRAWRILPTELAVTDWRVRSVNDEDLYGIKLEGVTTVLK